MYYIGIDCHKATMEMAVCNERKKIIHRKTIPTGVKGMMENIREIPRPRVVVIEEGCLASWVVETCTQFEEKVIVCNPKINRWIALAEDKADPLDAGKLALLASGGYVKEIYHPVGESRRLRELVLGYHDTVQMEVRIKNKIKAKFARYGISCSGRTVYLEKYRGSWRTKLEGEKVGLLLVEGLWKQLDQVRNHRLEILLHFRQQKRKNPQISRFMKVEGIGLIHALTFYAIVENPHRFADKKKLFSYMGIGIKRKSSGKTLYRLSLTRDFNRYLKGMIKQAAESAIRTCGSHYQKHYLRLVDEGMVSNRAKLTIARKMAATLYAMWKSGKEYDPGAHLDECIN